MKAARDCYNEIKVVSIEYPAYRAFPSAKLLVPIITKYMEAREAKLVKALRFIADGAKANPIPADVFIRIARQVLNAEDKP